MQGEYYFDGEERYFILPFEWGERLRMHEQSLEN
jgi:hypothetical protein